MMNAYDDNVTNSLMRIAEACVDLPHEIALLFFFQFRTSFSLQSASVTEARQAGLILL